MVRMGIDLDGVLCDMITPWLTVIAYEYGVQVPKVKDMDNYKFVSVFKKMGINISGNQISKVLPFIYKNNTIVPSYEDAAQFVLNCKIYTGTLPIVITSRHPWYQKECEEWCEMWLGVELECLHCKPHEKADLCIEKGINIFIEDRPDTADSIARKGIRSYLLNRPWNAKEEILPSVIRISSLNECWKTQWWMC